MSRSLRSVLFLCAWICLAAARPLPTLHWTGIADVHAGARVIQIQVETTVHPFYSARSESRIVGEPADSKRLMEIDAAGGSVTFQGKRRDLGALTSEHERQQYALYGLILTTRAISKCVLARHDGAPDTRLCFDRTGALVSGGNIISDPESGKPVAQTFTFEGELRSGGVRWPKRIRIYQEGRLYFDLTLLTFAVR